MALHRGRRPGFPSILETELFEKLEEREPMAGSRCSSTVAAFCCVPWSTVLMAWLIPPSTVAATAYSRVLINAVLIINLLFIGALLVGIAPR